MCRTVGCEDLPGLGDEPWLGREHGDERSPRFSFLEVLLAHQSFVAQRAADGGGGALQRVRCSVIAARIWPTPAILEQDRVAAK